MDTALKAMKRAARAVLRDDMRRLRKALKEARGERREATEHLRACVTDLQQRLAAETKAKTDYSNDLGYLRGRLGAMAQWQKEHAPHDRAFQCAVEYLKVPRRPQGFDTVCPFARWDLPKP